MEKLKLELNEIGFVGSDSTFVKKVRSDYNIVVDFIDNIITISNFYKDPKDNLDNGKRFVLFCGKCSSIEEFNSLLNIINIEN